MCLCHYPATSTDSGLSSEMEVCDDLSRVPLDGLWILEGIIVLSSFAISQVFTQCE